MSVVKNCLIVIFSLITSLSFSIQTDEVSNISVPVHSIPTPNLKQIQKEDDAIAAKGGMYRIGVFAYTNLTETNSGTWVNLNDGKRKWQLSISFPGAEALSFIFKEFKLGLNSKFYILDQEGNKISADYSKENVMEDGRLHVALCEGDFMTLVLIDDANTFSKINIDKVIYNYRSTGFTRKEKINNSESCEVNVNCSEGAEYKDEKQGIARVYVVSKYGAAWCSGSLVNNLAKDCKPYFLTALHCAPSNYASNSDMLLWKFYFNYEASNCSNPTKVGTLLSQFVDGCIRIADSDDNDGTAIQKSDFLLVQLGTLATESQVINQLKSFNSFWNGWDVTDLFSLGAVGIHHPSGDIKKISTSTKLLETVSYSGTTSNTHWSVEWAKTLNGNGVTEGGSSGSPLFHYNHGYSRIIGTLSGGASMCTALSAADYYGKMNYHWKSDGTNAVQQLQPFLDPNNTGVLAMNGSYSPCSDPKDETVFDGLMLYPNPVENVFIVDFWNTIYSDIAIYIFDVIGNEVYALENQKGNYIPVYFPIINPGLYQVKIKADNKIFFAKIIKK